MLVPSGVSPILDRIAASSKDRFQVGGYQPRAVPQENPSRDTDRGGEPMSLIRYAGKHSAVTEDSDAAPLIRPRTFAHFYPATAWTAAPHDGDYSW